MTYYWTVQSIAEGLKKGKSPAKGHSRTPSNASSTSQEVAMLTGKDGSGKETEESSSTPVANGKEEELEEVPLDRSNFVYFLWI